MGPRAESQQEKGPRIRRANVIIILDLLCLGLRTDSWSSFVSVVYGPSSWFLTDTEYVWQMSSETMDAICAWLGTSVCVCS